MLTRQHFRLRTLGRLALATVSGDAEVAAIVRPRHLAVLTVLAVWGRPVPRDTLVEMFWGGEPEERARHSLSNALSGLRALLGSDAISARRDQVSLADEVGLEVDAIRFTEACAARDDELAASQYGGAFLPGVHVSDAPAFDDWASRVRARLDRQLLELCERHVPALVASSRWADAARLAELWLEAAPRSTTALIALLHARAAPETPASLAGALEGYDRACRRLEEDYQEAPDASVVALAGKLRERFAEAERRLAHDVSAVAPPERAQAPAHRAKARPPARRPARWMIAAAATVLFVLALWMARRPAAASPTNRRIVAVTSVDDVRGDSAIAWLRAGLPRIIATDLDAMGGVEVVAPGRVRDVIVRLTGSGSARLSQDQATDVARRLGAGWAVTGGVSASKGGYLLDLTLRNVDDGSESESFTIFAHDPIELGRMAATRLATLLDVGVDGAGPRYSGIETSSPDAYRHFVRGMLAADAENFPDAARELDSAILFDSGFVDAIRIRRGVAAAVGDRATERRLAPVERREENRLPEVDRLSDEIRQADSLGEKSRADALSLQLVQRFPHDPRAYTARVELLTAHGRWADGERVLLRELALDSLAMSAGSGPCTPCVVLWRLSQVRLAEGDRAGAEAAARRWVALQPELPAAWRNLSATLAAIGRTAESVDAGFHMVALSKSSLAAVDFGRTMLSARRYDLVDSLLASWRRSRDPILVDGEHDLRAMLARERGRFAASVEALSSLPLTNGLLLVRADGLARIGRLREARELLEWSGHPAGSARTGQLTPSEARGFTWSHAIEADALVRAGDTTAARALVDSITRAASRSYYDRDKLLAHHVQGMLDFSRGDFADAARELRAAEWATNGWTRTNLELARAELAQHHDAAALAALRDAYLAPMDGMGRYVPRSELDWWMARTFAAARQDDSAAVYARYVREAWRRADPDVRARLDSLPPRNQFAGPDVATSAVAANSRTASPSRAKRSSVEKPRR